MRPSLLSALLVLAATCAGATETQEYQASKPILLASARGMGAYKPEIRPLLAKALLTDVVVSASPRTGGSLSGGGVVGGDLLLWTGVDISLSSTGTINWSSTALPSGWKDIGFSRPSDGLLKVTNGGTGLGVLQAGKLTLTSLGTPSTPVITQGGAGGATAYSYRVVAKLPDATTTEAGIAGSTATGNAALDGTNYNIVTWAATTNAHCYDVWRTAGGATQGKILTCVTSPQNDTGIAGVGAGTEPLVNATGTIGSSTNGVVIGRGATGVGNYAISLGENAASAGNLGISIGMNTTSSGISIGFSADSTIYGVAIGKNAQAMAAGTAIGDDTSTGGVNGGVAVGYGSTLGGASLGSVAIGTYAASTAAGEFVSGHDAWPITNVYFGDGVTSATPTAYTINGGGALGSDIVGGDLQLAPGISTGAAVPGKVKIRSTVPIGTGSTSQTLYDAWIFGGGGALWAKSGTKTLTESAATSFVLLAIANNSRQGGIIDYCIDADDGTEFQTRCGSIPFAMITKAAVETCTVGTAADAVAVSSSTLTVAFTADTSPANGCYYQANAVSGLTQTTLRINYTVNLYGNAATAVTPQ